MNQKYELLISENNKFAELMAQQLRVSERVEALNKDIAAIFAKLMVAVVETKRITELELRGVATEAEVAAAKDIEVTLHNQFVSLQERIEVVRTAGANMVGEINLARNKAEVARDSFLTALAETQSKSIRGDTKLRQRLLEIYAALAHSSSRFLDSDWHLGIHWAEVLAEVFIEPTRDEHLAALANFKAKHEIPVLGKFSASSR